MAVLSPDVDVGALIRDDGHVSDTAQAAVTVYWRPGCGFCSRLRRDLDQRGIEASWVDIWQDDEARAFVRSVARGNETVPTVVVGDQPMVNPRGGDVAAAVWPDRQPPSDRPGPLRRLMGG